MTPASSGGEGGGFYGLAPMLCRPIAIRGVLLDTLNVLRGGLPTPTGSIQFLKSRSGLALSLFNFFRFVRPLVFLDCRTNILRKGAPCIPP